MTCDQPLVIDALERKQEPCRNDALLAAVAVNEGVQPSDYDGAKLASNPFFEYLDVAYEAVIC